MCCRWTLGHLRQDEEQVVGSKNICCSIFGSPKKAVDPAEEAAFRSGGSKTRAEQRLRLLIGLGDLFFAHVSARIVRCCLYGAFVHPQASATHMCQHSRAGRLLTDPIHRFDYGLLALPV